MKLTPPKSITNPVVGFPKSTAWQTSGQWICSPTSGFDIGLELYYAQIRHHTCSAAKLERLRREAARRARLLIG